MINDRQKNFETDAGVAALLTSEPGNTHFRLDLDRGPEMTTRTALILFVLSLLPTAASAQPGPRRTIAFEPPKTHSPAIRNDPVLAKLSPELAEIVEHDAVLIGEQRDGRLVSDVPQDQSDELRGRPRPVQKVDYVNTELIVTYSNGQRPSNAELQAMGFQLVDDNRIGQFLVVKPTDENGNGAGRPRGVRGSAMHRLASSPAVGKVYRNAILTIPEQPDQTSGILTADEFRSAASGDLEFDRVRGVIKTNAPLVQRVSNPREIVVAVIDTGVDFTHQDLRDNMWVNEQELKGRPNFDDDNNGIVDDIHGAAFHSGRQLGSPTDDNGHGTHCAGTVAGVKNGIGVAGMAQTRIMALKFLRSDGSGSTADAVRCIDYAIRKEADILSSSWGGPGSIPPVLHDAIARAQAAGILFVAAAGNDGLNNDSRDYSPANSTLENVLTVGSVNFAGQRSRFSNFGLNNVDIGAPGGTGGNQTADDILSTWPGNRYRYLAGTSMATPHVAGAAALLWGHPRFHGSSFLDIKVALLRNARQNSQLASFWRDGLELDVRFLTDEPDPVEPPTPPGDVPEKEFYYPTAKEFADNTTLLIRRITLEEPATLHLFANASAAGVIRPETFSNGIQIGEKHFKPSFRLATTGGPEGYVSFGTSLTVRLDRGTHNIKWWIRLQDGGRIAIRGGGVLEVQAFADAAQ